MNRLERESRTLLANCSSKRQTGFTLVELAVVVVLIGILASMGLSVANVQLANAAVSATKTKQDTIKSALIAYLRTHNRLPCPATDILGGLDANARTLTGPPPNCITNFGLVPYLELGLPKSAALDGWDNFFSYAVSPQWTATLSTTVNIGTQTTNPLQAFNVGNTGVITARDRVPATGPIIIANGALGYGLAPAGAVLAIISSGINGASAYTTKGTQNAPPPALSVDEISNALPTGQLPAPVALPAVYQREYTANTTVAGGAFDDMVMWLAPNDLLTPIIKDGALNSPEAQWAQQVANIKNSIAAQIFSSSTCVVILTMPTIYKTDPWGGAVTFSASFPLISSASTTPIYNLTVTSPNPSAPIITGPTASQLFVAYPAFSKNCP